MPTYTLAQAAAAALHPPAPTRLSPTDTPGSSATPAHLSSFSLSSAFSADGDHTATPGEDQAEEKEKEARCPETSLTSSDARPWRPRLDEYHPSLVRAADLAARFIADLARGAPPYWLTFAGEPGVGKTLLARQTWLEARRYLPAATAGWPAQTGLYDERRRRPACRWLDAADFARLYLDDRQYDLPEYLAHEWLVGFDDLGAKSDAKDLLADALYRLAQRRLGRWTLWTTNLTLDEIARRIDARVSSRLIRDANRLVTIAAPDYALKR